MFDEITSKGNSSVCRTKLKMFQRYIAFLTVMCCLMVAVAWTTDSCLSGIVYHARHRTSDIAGCHVAANVSRGMESDQGA